jgi:hypothetical protein
VFGAGHAESGRNASASADAALRALARLVTERGREMSPAQRRESETLLLAVLERASPEAAGEAATLLSASEDAPRGALLALARGPLTVARPVLTQARSLSGADLVGLLREASPAHLRAAAQRPGLTEDATELLALRGDREAILLALANPSARFSAGRLAHLAGDPDRSLRALLIARGDLPEAVLDQLWPALTPDERARAIAAGWRYGEGEVMEAVREAQGALVAQVRGGTLPLTPDGVRRLVDMEAVSLDEAAAGLIEERRLVEAAGIVARDLERPVGLVLNLMTGGRARGVAVLARAAGLDAALDTLAAVRADWGLSGPGRRLDRALAEVGVAEADNLLDRLDALWGADLVGPTGLTRGRRRLPAD